MSYRFQPWAQAGAFAALLAACGSPAVQGAPVFPVPTGEWRQVIPADNLPAGVTTQGSNNNLDIALLDGSLFVAFRTAPTHFASTDTVLYVLRNDDPWTLSDWHFEAMVDLDRDLREPRLFTLGGRLFLYFSLLGTELTSFDPGGVMAMAREPDGTWSAPVTVFTDGRIVWRTKTRQDRVYMTAYAGGENIYQGRGSDMALDLYFLTTDDGWTWRGVDPDRPVVLRGGISETDFEFDDAGNLFAVSRNETGDDSGFGSRLCSARRESLGVWTCAPASDPHKYDSPYMFKYGPFIYLIARFNPAGPYDNFGGAPATVDHWWINEYRYSTTPKRTALYGYDTAAMRITTLDVFPTNGDTAFASGVWLDHRHHLTFNYSSYPTAPEMAWIEGQFSGTQIYAAILEFPE